MLEKIWERVKSSCISAIIVGAIITWHVFFIGVGILVGYSTGNKDGIDKVHNIIDESIQKNIPFTFYQHDAGLYEFVRINRGKRRLIIYRAKQEEGE